MWLDKWIRGTEEEETDSGNVAFMLNVASHIIKAKINDVREMNRYFKRQNWTHISSKNRIHFKQVRDASKNNKDETTTILEEHADTFF